MNKDFFALLYNPVIERVLDKPFYKDSSCFVHLVTGHNPGKNLAIS
jgi:hypothetical protein